MNNAELIAKLKDLRRGVFKDGKAVDDLIWECIRLASATPPARPELTDEELEDASHKWANSEPPWSGPVERTYARTVFKDGLRYARDNGYLAPAKPFSSHDYMIEVLDIIKSEVNNADGAIATGIHKDVARGVAWVAIKHRLTAKFGKP